MLCAKWSSQMARLEDGKLCGIDPLHSITLLAHARSCSYRASQLNLPFLGMSSTSPIRQGVTAGVKRRRQSDLSLSDDSCATATQFVKFWTDALYSLPYNDITHIVCGTMPTSTAISGSIHLRLLISALSACLLNSGAQVSMNQVVQAFIQARELFTGHAVRPASVASVVTTALRLIPSLATPVGDSCFIFFTPAQASAWLLSKGASPRVPLQQTADNTLRQLHQFILAVCPDTPMHPADWPCQDLHTLLTGQAVCAQQRASTPWHQLPWTHIPEATSSTARHLAAVIKSCQVPGVAVACSALKTLCKGDCPAHDEYSARNSCLSRWTAAAFHGAPWYEGASWTMNKRSRDVWATMNASAGMLWSAVQAGRLSSVEAQRVLAQVPGTVRTQYEHAARARCPQALALWWHCSWWAARLVAVAARTLARQESPAHALTGVCAIVHGFACTDSDWRYLHASAQAWLWWFRLAGVAQGQLPPAREGLCGSLEPVPLHPMPFDRMGDGAVAWRVSEVQGGQPSLGVAQLASAEPAVPCSAVSLHLPAYTAWLSVSRAHLGLCLPWVQAAASVSEAANREVQPYLTSIAPVPFLCKPDVARSPAYSSPYDDKLTCGELAALGAAQQLVWNAQSKSMGVGEPAFCFTQDQACTGIRGTSKRRFAAPMRIMQEFIEQVTAALQPSHSTSEDDTSKAAATSAYLAAAIGAASIAGHSSVQPALLTAMANVGATGALPGAPWLAALARLDYDVLPATASALRAAVLAALWQLPGLACSEPECVLQRMQRSPAETAAGSPPVAAAFADALDLPLDCSAAPLAAQLLAVQEAVAGSIE